MLIYDEWVVPGEVEYAEKKAAEIEEQIERYHKTSLRGDWMRDDWNISIQITEHIVGKFGVTIPKPVWDYAIYDIDINNSMKLDWFRDEVAPIDEPKIFDLPADDIRSSLPEWDDSLFPENVLSDVMDMHSKRYISNAIREAYLNASIRSRRIIPNRIDCENLYRGFEVDCYPINNYECLYQGKAGNLVIRFLFDYKDMKIVMAYPVLKEIREKSDHKEYSYYNKEGKYFTWGYFRV